MTSTPPNHRPRYNNDDESDAEVLGFRFADNIPVDDPFDERLGDEADTDEFAVPPAPVMPQPRSGIQDSLIRTLGAGSEKVVRQVAEEIRRSERRLPPLPPLPPLPSERLRASAPPPWPPADDDPPPRRPPPESPERPHLYRRPARKPVLTNRQRRWRRIRGTLYYLAKYTFITIIGLVTSVPYMVISLQVAPPDESAFMRMNEGEIQDSMDLEYMNRFLLVALIGQEDQEFMTRNAPVDAEVMLARATAFLHGEPDPSGSTLPQQLAKNMFLSGDYTALRKGEEYVLAYGMTMLMSKHDIVEMYLNYAQFGPDLFGVCDAYWYYFNHSPMSSDINEAASLIGLLPSPTHVRRADGPAGGLDFQPFIDAYNADPVGHPYDINSYLNSLDGPGDYPRWQDHDLGGLERVTDLLGVDTAAHDEPRRDDNRDCADMPDNVRERLIAEGYEF